MKMFFAEEIRDADRRTIASGTSGEELMGRASKALARELVFFADGAPRSVVIVAGPGNNGGDGFGIAAHLFRLGWKVEVWVAAARERVQGDARAFLERVESLQVPLLWKPEVTDWESAALEVPPGAWLVDALLGTGAGEAPRNAPAAAIAMLQTVAEDHRIWSVDLPSGLNADTGAPFDTSICVSADTTLTLGGPKKGFSEEGAIRWTGAVHVLELGIALPESEPVSSEWEVLTDREIREELPASTPEDHKGSRGHALFIGGSPGMSGSISMAAMAALRSGCGLSTVLAPFTTALSIDAFHQELMVLPGKQGKFMTLFPQGIRFAPYQAVCVGPGLRVNPETIDAVRRICQECPHPMVVDADGLNCLSVIGIRIGDSRRPVFLTPHPGEMGRLLEKSRRAVQEDRSAAVREAAQASHAHVVLKGSHSRVVSPKGLAWINLSGNAGLATGGTGDVLAGIVTGLVARGIRKPLVLPVATALHGRAGELASIRKGMTGVLAGDVLEALPAVFRHAEGR